MCTHTRVCPCVHVFACVYPGRRTHAEDIRQSQRVGSLLLCGGSCYKTQADLPCSKHQQLLSHHARPLSLSYFFEAGSFIGPRVQHFGQTGLPAPAVCVSPPLGLEVLVTPARLSVVAEPRCRSLSSTCCAHGDVISSPRRFLKIFIFIT